MGSGPGARRFFRGEVRRLVAYVEHSNRLKAVSSDGKATVREHLEAAARMGSERAQRQLEGPEYPEHLDYLWEWLMQLHGRSGVGMSGLAPLSYATIAAWSAFTGERPTHMEVEALIELDAVLLARPRKQDDE